MQTLQMQGNDGQFYEIDLGSMDRVMELQEAVILLHGAVAELQEEVATLDAGYAAKSDLAESAVLKIEEALAESKARAAEVAEAKAVADAALEAEAARLAETEVL